MAVGLTVHPLLLPLRLHVPRPPGVQSQVLPPECGAMELLRLTDQRPGPGKSVGVMFFGDGTVAW